MVRAPPQPRAQPNESSLNTGERLVSADNNGNNPFDLTGRVAIITGTSRGLGQYLARALAKSGADLILTARNRDHLAPFEAEVKSLGRRAPSLELDVRNHDSIRKFAADAESAFGKIDILVNNAGCNVRKPAL